MYFTILCSNQVLMILKNLIEKIHESKPGLSGGSVLKNWPDNAGNKGLIPGKGRLPGGRKGNPFQHSCL